MPGLRISEVAKRTQLSVDTLRYYEKIGLIPIPKKNNRGYKEYTESELRYITFIVNLKRTDMSLASIKSYIDAYKRGEITDCYQLLERHAKDVEKQIEERQSVLQTIHYKLEHFKEIDGGGKKS
ncbi:DNA-binding transcriptional MerR regulator [Pullulanibacillus pueri]|uniref:MerR family transcriptional regulator n=1 Tax=Pullulanibacillus pueri TaxID=1437324 RepID=A0A8J3EMC5_9BACL|nr:MerR family transcriptional regulator [Pullulanibacillus pueri]MBM7682748.1 DNA-binding transcriptional MerR regulator [Pullulanibacillus pueri]GGH83035.1 MerR family transcriptional regulator [Pullulanibacillus pueri]